MARELVLRAGEAFRLGLESSVVGAAPQLNDGSDATYGVVGNLIGPFSQASRIDGRLPRTLNIGTPLRVYASARFAALQPETHELDCSVVTAAGAVLYEFGTFTPPVASPTTVSVELTPTLANSGAQLVAVLASSLPGQLPYIRFASRLIADWATNGSRTLHYAIYEASITLILSGVLPPLRQHPRSDGLGTSTARRHWPPPASQQASNRRAGGYYY